MRIAMVSEHASPLALLGGPDAGGQNVHVDRLSRTLAGRGHRVTVYTRRDAPASELPDRTPLAPGVTVEHVPAGPPEPLPKDELLAHMPEFGAHLARAWAAEPPDVVHAHFWMSGLAALRGAGAYGPPVVLTYHALGTVKRRHQGARDTSPPERVGVERDIGRGCAGVLATCTDEVAELTAMGLDRGRIEVVPCGVDTGHFRPGAGGSGTGAGPPVGGPRLLAVGRLVPRKGFEAAVRAVAQLPGARLDIAGGPEPDRLTSDPEAVRLRRLAAECGAGDRVRLLGGVPYERMPEVMRGATVLLSTPVYEPFGIVPLEAMACAVPVVATGVGGQRDTVADGVTGRLVPADDPGALARTTGELLGDPARLASFGEAGRRRVLERFTWERVADGAERMYVRVAAPAPATAEVTR